ncbi:MAG TPA: NAD-dependent epimerase/dehydratase family protein [Polyangia bacterium]|nr:NAD-dependent epimerase/dehydratase family protein [Polyangia bacterium]
MKVLVTGGAGHLGANLLRRLQTDGDVSIRALARKSDNNEGITSAGVEAVYGDLCDLPSLRAAVKGVDRIYHAAAQISTVAGKENELFQNNVIGTKNLLSAAREAGCGRVVVTGSFSAVGHRSDGRPSDETEPFNPFDHVMPYEKSKQAVELECLRAVAEGQDVVIATSCAILGPNDFMPSRMGAVLRDFANGKLRAYIPGGFEFVAARDIAEGHVLAMAKGRTGHKYIISSGFHSMDTLMDIFERVTGRKRPRRLPAGLLAMVAPISQLVQSTLFPSRPQRLTPGAIRVLRLNRHADTSKAQRELGFRPTPIEDAVREAYQFFANRGDIRNPLRNEAARSTVAKDGTSSENRAVG